MVPFVVVRQLFLLNKKDEYVTLEPDRLASGVDGSLFVLKTFCESKVVSLEEEVGIPNLTTL